MLQNWYEDAIFYHIYTFSAAQAEFFNDYSKVEHKLSKIERWTSHIKSLSCNAVLLSPVLKSHSHGYDVINYYEIDNRIGTNEEFKNLVEKFHETGIRVVLDSVFNHCGRDFFAFQALLGGDLRYADWFSGVDFSRKSPMGDPFDYETWGGYYELVKLNLKNKEVVDYLLGAARIWIEYFDIDGMRLDAADVLDFDFMRSLRSLACGIKADFWLMGEVIGGDYRRWVAPGLLHSVTNYILFKGLFSSHNDMNLYELAHTLQDAVPESGLPLYTFLDNHDQPRIASNISNPAYLNTLYALLFTLPGVPSIYYGSEWGIHGMKENGSDQPLRPYIDIENPPSGITGLAEYISKLAALRSAEKALKYGGYRQVYIEYHRPFIFERHYENERIFVAVNCMDKNERLNLSGQSGSGLIDILSGEPIVTPHSIPINPYSARILKLSI